jgi:hypothetical protein
LIINVKRFAHGENDTLGLLFLDGEFFCYTLEDEYRSQKVYGKTRIPKGEYILALRTIGGFHRRYKQKFGEQHIGMLEILNVPDFTNVLIHIGNRDDDTAGCLLVGDGLNNNTVDDGFLSSSTNAYRRLYLRVFGAVRGGQASILFTDL